MSQGMPPQVSLRALREVLGMTLEQVAAGMQEQGVETTRFTLSNIETGRRRASARLMEAWARVLGIKAMHIRQDREIREYIGAVDADTHAHALEPAA